jgi:hypothetical protein
VPNQFPLQAVGQTLRIPGDGDQRSDLMAISIPN